MGVDAPVARPASPDARGAAEALGEAADGAADLVDLGVGERQRRGRSRAPLRGARCASSATRASYVCFTNGADLVFGAVECARQGVGELTAAVAESVDESGAQARQRLSRAACPDLARSPVGQIAEHQSAVGVEGPGQVPTARAAGRGRRRGRAASRAPSHCRRRGSRAARAAPGARRARRARNPAPRGAPRASPSRRPARARRSARRPRRSARRSLARRTTRHAIASRTRARCSSPTSSTARATSMACAVEMSKPSRRSVQSSSSRTRTRARGSTAMGRV